MVVQKYFRNFAAILLLFNFVLYDEFYMDEYNHKNEKIAILLKTKSVIKQRIFDNTYKVYKILKEVLDEQSAEYTPQLMPLDSRVTVEYIDRGMFEAQLKIAGDMLVFSMFTNAFSFDHSHSIWKNPYVAENPYNSICGMISIYNFLNDSFRYHRTSDLGYLIARIFVNHEFNYFVEGKQQTSNWVNRFGSEQITKDILRDIVESAILYTLSFDLFAPPYDAVKIITVAQMNEKIESERFQTGKRLGFTFNSDDVSDQLKL